MDTCNKIIVTIDGLRKPCICVNGHVGGCNPFSPNPYMGVVIGKNQFHKRDLTSSGSEVSTGDAATSSGNSLKREDMPHPRGNTARFTPVEPYGNIWTEQSNTKRCLWSGSHSRCIYEFGHTIPHKEETTI